MSGERRTSDPKGDSVRSLRRGLAILRYVNSVRSTNPAEIASVLDIPRSTVYRLLQTLEEDGYVRYSSSDNRVRVARLAASLGDSYVATTDVCHVAGPIFGEYGPKLVWPLDLSVYEDAAMVVEETTHPRSPLSVDRGMIGSRLPVLRTSAGRVYLAHCSERERSIIVEQIRRLGDPKDASYLTDRYLNPMLAEAARRGYAVRAESSLHPKTASVAVPVVVDRSVRATVSMIWIRSAMDLETSIATYVPALQEIAATIAEAAARS